MKKIILAILALNLFFSCQTIDLNQIEIDYLALQITEENNPTTSVRKLLPGTIYRIKIKVRYDDKILTSPNYNDFLIESPNNSFEVIRQSRSDLYIKTAENPFFLLDDRFLSMHISLRNNNYIQKDVYPLDLNCDFIDYSGERGFPGAPGQPGTNATLLAVLYNISPDPQRTEPVLLLVDVDSYQIYMTKNNTIEVDVGGGAGGDGLNGQDYTDGGSGGDGGAIRILYFNPSVTQRIKMTSQGGRGGEPGKLHTIEEDGYLIENEMGEYGVDGATGYREFFNVSYKETIRMLKRVLGEHYSEKKLITH